MMILECAQKQDLEKMNAEECLEWMFETFGSRHYLACSFQATTSVLAHMASNLNPEARFFYIDTDVLFPETYQTKAELEHELGIKFDRYHQLSLEEQARDHGSELWKSDPDLCCTLRKVTPMHTALETVDCWAGGVRRSDSADRAGTPKLMQDPRFGILKLNPLADWDEKDVWNYIAENRLPYNPLHDQGYPSIGCTHCTAPVAPGADPRSGRWAGHAKSECGIN